MWVYHVTYDGNGSTEGTAPEDLVAYAGGVKATVLSKPDTLNKTSSDDREEWIFLGWTDNEEGTGTIYKEGDEVAFDANITLYAKWDQVKGVARTKEGSGRRDCTWTVLWYDDTDNDGQNDAPKFADFNVGSTISDYSFKTTYTTANVGGLYSWGGSNERREGTSEDDKNTASNLLSGDSDTATKLWGRNWKMMTNEQLEMLKDTNNTTWTSETYECSSLNGYTVKGKGDYADYSIFLPLAGRKYESSLTAVGNQGYYWTSTPDSTYAKYLDCKGNYSHGENSRSQAYSVRAILAE